MSFRRVRLPLKVQMPKETQVEASKRLANVRVNIALRSLRMISNLASYKYALTRGHWDQILVVLDETLAEVKSKVEEHLSSEGKQKEEEQRFTLRDPP